MKSNKRGSWGSGCVVLLSLLFSLPPFPPLERQRHGIICVLVQEMFPNKLAMMCLQITDNTSLVLSPCGSSGQFPGTLPKLFLSDLLILFLSLLNNETED